LDFRKTGHLLEIDDIRTLIRSEPATIVIGTGMAGRMRVAPTLVTHLKHLGIHVNINSNTEAVKLYNQQIQNRAKISACFHLTC